MATAIFVLGDMGWGNHMDNWGAGWWILMTVLMVAFWGLVIFGVVWLVRSLVGGNPSGHGRNAIELLDHRLASGEISPEEYRQRRAVLTGNDAGASGES